MTTLEQIKTEREAREVSAKLVAAALPAGDYYADGNDCVNRLTGVKTPCATHWDACLVMLAAAKF